MQRRPIEPVYVVDDFFTIRSWAIKYAGNFGEVARLGMCVQWKLRLPTGGLVGGRDLSFALVQALEELPKRTSSRPSVTGSGGKASGMRARADLFEVLFPR